MSFRTNCELSCSRSVKSAIGSSIPFYFVCTLIPLVLQCDVESEKVNVIAFPQSGEKFSLLLLNMFSVVFFFIATY